MSFTETTHAHLTIHKDPDGFTLWPEFDHPERGAWAVLEPTSGMVIGHVDQPGPEAERIVSRHKRQAI